MKSSHAASGGQAWRLRWGSMLASARAVASSLLELRRPHGADGEIPPLMKWTPSSGMLGSRELLRVRA